MFFFFIIITFRCTTQLNKTCDLRIYIIKSTINFFSSVLLFLPNNVYTQTLEILCLRAHSNEVPIYRSCLSRVDFFYVKKKRNNKLKGKKKIFRKICAMYWSLLPVRGISARLLLLCRMKRKDHRQQLTESEPFASSGYKGLPVDPLSPYFIRNFFFLPSLYNYFFT